MMVDRCGHSKDSEETTDCILIHCDRTKKLWNLILVIFGLKQVYLDTVKNLLLGWKAKAIEKRQKKIWCMVPLCLFGVWFLIWCIWKERNRRILYEEELLGQRLKGTFLKSVLEWSWDAMGMEIVTMLDFLGSLNCDQIGLLVGYLVQLGLFLSLLYTTSVHWMHLFCLVFS